MGRGKRILLQCQVLPFVIIFVALLVLAIAGGRRSRARAVARIRAGWGQPIDRERKLDAIVESHRSRLANIGAGAGLDDRTWEDLNLDEVFAALDRTESTLGQHALYHRLRTAPVADHLQAFDALVNRLGTDAPLRERAQIALARLQDPHGYDLWWLARPDAIDVRPWYVLFPVLTVATMALVGLAPFWPQVVPALIATFVVNLVVRYLTDFRIGATARAFRQLAPVIASGQSLQFLEGDDFQPLVGAFRSDGPSLGRLKTIARWVSGDPLMLPLNSSSLAVLTSDLVSTVYEYLNLLFLLDANGVYFGAGELRARAPALFRLIAALGEVDAAISVASLRAGRSDWTQPRFRATGTPARVTDVRHPLVQDAVANTITLGLGEGVLITGSNMSGKSTFLRTIGVTTIMAQTLNTCLATAYEAPVFHVRSCIGRADDLLTGRSYYIVEVESLLGLVDASADTSPHLFLLDELFRGTNTVERIAAGQAVLRELVVAANCPKPHVVIAATHDGELVDLLSDVYVAYHFGDAVAADGLVFDHRLVPGKATTRNAIALLRLHGAPEALTTNALACAAELDRQRGTTVVGR
jgi:hypothetical protein